MTATGRGRSTAALLGPVVAVVLLVGACAKSDELTDPVIPLGSIVPLEGGGDFPDPARVLLQEADRELRAGDFDGAAEAARRASAGAGPATKCVADAVQGVADVNRGNVETGLEALQDGECAIKAVPGEVREEMTTLIYRTQAVGSALSGDEAAAEQSLEDALQAAPEMKNAIVAQFCRAVAQYGSFERCAPAATSPQPATVPTSAVPTPVPISTAPTTSKSSVPTSAVPTTSKSPVSTSAVPTSAVPTTSKSPAPTSAVPTTSKSPIPTSAVPTTSKSSVARTTRDSAPTTSAG